MNKKIETTGQPIRTSTIITILSLLVVGFTIGAFTGYTIGWRVATSDEKKELAVAKEKEARIVAYQAEMATQKAAESEFKAKASEMRADEQRLLADLAKQKAIFAQSYALAAKLDAKFPNATFIRKGRNLKIEVLDLKQSSQWYLSLFEGGSKEDAVAANFIDLILENAATLRLTALQKINPSCYYYACSLDSIKPKIERINASIIKNVHQLENGCQAIYIKDPSGNEIRFVECEN